ncbi:MAG: hypothetical protein KC591_16715 [Gemmatimonadetes bacterium]|nr:hypothetical protein [Gemmatimonadota bacterium]
MEIRSLLSLLAVLTASSDPAGDGRSPEPPRSSRPGPITAVTDCADFALPIRILGEEFTWRAPGACASGVVVRDAEQVAGWLLERGTEGFDPIGPRVMEVYSMDARNPCGACPSSIPQLAERFSDALRCSPPELLRVGIVAGAFGEHEPGSTASSFRARSRAGDSVRVVRDFPVPATSGTEDPLDAFLATLPRDPDASLPPILRGVRETCAGLGGIELSGTVRIERRGAARAIEHRTFQGSLLADGRFRIAVPHVAEDESGSEHRLLEDLAFDGSSFVSGLCGAEAYHAWTASSPVAASVRAAKTSFLPPLQRWLVNPGAIHALARTNYTVQRLSSNELRITEHYPETDYPAWAGSLVRDVDTSIAGGVVTRLEIRSNTGGLLERREFGDFRRLRCGVWRPFTFCESRGFSGGEDPELVIRVTIDSVGHDDVDPSAAAEAFWMPEPAGGWWVVHE